MNINYAIVIVISFIVYVFVLNETPAAHCRRSVRNTKGRSPPEQRNCTKCRTAGICNVFS